MIIYWWKVHFYHPADQSDLMSSKNSPPKWVKEIKILGVTITCDLKSMEIQNFDSKYETIENIARIAKSCPENISSVVKVSSSFY